MVESDASGYDITVTVHALKPVAACTISFSFKELHVLSRMHGLDSWSCQAKWNLGINNVSMPNELEQLSTTVIKN